MAVVLLCALVSLAWGCSKDNALEKKMLEAIENPSLRNEQTFNEMTAIIMANQNDYGEYMRPDGHVDIDRLQATLDRMGTRHDPNFKWDLKAYGGVVDGPLRLRLMLERSGSMTGYDSRRGSGDFKRALGDLLTRFPNDGKEIFIVNDGVYPYSGTLDSFVQDKDIFASTAKTGDPSYTDFAAIFNFALTDSVPERVTVLVTDMIYSPRDTEGVSAAKIFNEEGTLAAGLFSAHKDKSVIVVKLSTDFHGTYYPYSRPAGVAYDGQRPYYMIITGSASAMQKLRTAPEYASFTDFATLPGYEEDYFFNRGSLPIAYYSVMPRGKGCRGSYSLDGERGTGGIHAVKDAKPERDGTMDVRVAVDLSQVPADASYLKDMANYKVDGPGVVIKDIEEVAPEMIDARNKRYLDKATHLFTLQCNGKNLPDKCEVHLLNRMPAWIKASSSASDLNTSAASFGHTTFGLQEFMQGVYNAYYGTATVPDFTSFIINFS